MDMEGIEDIEGMFESDPTKVANSVFETRVSFFCLYTTPIFSIRQLDQASMKDILHTLDTLQYTACVKMEQLKSQYCNG